MTLFKLFTILAALTAAGGCSTVPIATNRVAAAPQAFVVAANPLAAQAGAEVLRRGGSAVDAAVAVQAMLSLVEPQSSGLGGGAFINHYDGRTKAVTIYDGREVAPAQASAAMFMGADAKPLPFAQAVVSGRSTGVPGAVAALHLAQREHGKLHWSGLFKTAEQTAQQGFIVSPRLAGMVARNIPQNGQPDVRAYFGQGPGGRPVRAGDRIKNPAYAEFLRRLARDGPSALYSGSTAAKIVQRTRQEPLGGDMTVADLAGYKPIKRRPLCETYRVYLVCVPPPPSSGVALLQLLKILERTDIARHGPSDPQAWFLFAEASRLMYADRDQYVGDPGFVAVPVPGLLDPAYVARRAAMIGDSAGAAPRAGTPRGASVRAADRSAEPVGTSHFIVGDAAGNVVSMTTTVESVFGSGRMVDGFFLNNQLTDFSFNPVEENGAPAANAPAPGKRPRSSMTPAVLLTSDRHFAGAIGSAGGSAILAYVGKSLVGAIDWGLPMQQALALPNLVARGDTFNGEVSKFSPELMASLSAKGVLLKPGQGEDSGVHAVLIRDGRIDGGFDPRREGVVLIVTP